MENFRKKEKRSFSIDKIELAFKEAYKDCCFNESLIQLADAILMSGSSMVLETEFSRFKIKIDIERFYQTANQEDKPTKRSGCQYMIEAYDDEYESIEEGLNRDFDRYGTSINRIMNILICNGDRGEPDERIKCKRMFGVFKTDLEQLKYLAEYLYNVPPLTFHTVKDFTFQDIIDWKDSVCKIICIAQDVEDIAINEIYKVCVKLCNDIDDICKKEMDSLNRIRNDDRRIKLAFDEALNKFSAIIPESGDVESFRKNNMLFDEYISNIDVGRDEDAARLAVAKKYYRVCTADDLKKFKSYHDYFECNKMSEIERKIFGTNIKKMNEVKAKLASFKGMKKTKLKDSCIPICYDLYHNSVEKCSQEMIFNYARENCNNENFFSLRTMIEEFKVYEKKVMAS